MNSQLSLATAPAERAGGVWSYISPSRLNLWLKCPLAWKLKYIDGIETPTTPALFVGKMVHAGLESHYRHRQLGLPLDRVAVADRMRQSWARVMDEEQMVFQSVAEELSCRRQALELVAEYLKKVPNNEPRPLAVEAALEAPLVNPATGEDLGIPLIGSIDLILDLPAGPVITDFKTASKSSEPLEITHEIQLSSYSYLFRQHSPQPESGLEIRSLIKTKTPQTQFHRYPARGEQHFRRLFAVIRAYLDNLEAARFVFRPGLTCSYCDYRDNGCRKWAG